MSREGGVWKGVSKMETVSNFFILRRSQHLNLCYEDGGVILLPRHESQVLLDILNVVMRHLCQIVNVYEKIRR